MDEENKKFLKNLGAVSSIGISMALAIGISVFFGLKLDKWLGTKPWFFFIFLLIGIITSFYNIFVIVGRVFKDSDSSEDKRK
jgi:F0F1-type ATP synthase assembly protein I